MIINFRQGIITYPISGTMQQFLAPTGQHVSLRADIGRVEVAFAHGADNYLLTETEEVVNAWGPLPAATDCWLYWDIDKHTAARTFGFTTVEPLYGAVEPAMPVVDQHWFDTTVGTMYVYTSGAFREVIRVFATKVNANVFTPMGYGFPLKPYAGTQVGMSLGNASVGRILVDELGNPLRRSTGHFFTTEHNFFVDGSPVNILRLESAVLTGTAQFENLHAYQVVVFSEFGEISHATYNDIQNGAVAILLEDVSRYNVGTVCLQGHITNPVWNWTVVGAPLWIDDTGNLVEYDLHETNPSTYTIGRSPVARVITQHSIMFDQGLGGKGERGAPGPSAQPATTTTSGSVRLSVPPANFEIPISVGDNDPRLTDARTPTAHSHVATAILPSPYMTLTGANLQLMLQQLEDNKLAVAGGTMSGSLILSSDPTIPLAAATKQYVDGVGTAAIASATAASTAAATSAASSATTAAGYAIIATGTAVGGALAQAPSNAMLGSAAYVDHEALLPRVFPTTKTTAYTVTLADNGKVIVASGTTTITLPPAGAAYNPSNAFSVTIKAVAGSTITVSRQGTDTIETVAGNKSMTANTALTFFPISTTQWETM